jgi:hypothetical protein
MESYEVTGKETRQQNGEEGPASDNGQDTPTIHFTPAEHPMLAPDMTADGKRKRVGFTEDTTPPPYDHVSLSSRAELHGGELVASPETTSPPDTLRPSPTHSRQPSMPDNESSSIRRNDISDLELSMQVHRAFGQPYVPKPKPAIRKTNHTPDIELGDMADVNLNSEGTQKIKSGLDAHDRAQKLAARVGSYNVSEAASRRNSVDSNEVDSYERPSAGPAYVEEDGQDTDEDLLFQKQRTRPSQPLEDPMHAEARRLVRTYTQRQNRPDSYYDTDSPTHSGQMTPVADQSYAEDYVPKPKKYRGGVLASLLKLQSHREEDDSFSPISGRRKTHTRGWSTDHSTLGGTTPAHTPGNSPPRSGTSTPTHKHGLLHWPKKHGGDSSHGLAHLIGSSSTLALPTKEFGEELAERGKVHKPSRPGPGKRSKSSEAISSAFKRMSRPHLEEQIKITVHIAETLSRQKYLVKLCRALMEYGAPTHRLEGTYPLFTAPDLKLT